MTSVKKRDPMRPSCSSQCMTLQQDSTDANTSTPFCWTSARRLIKFHIGALLLCSMIMELEIMDTELLRR